MVGAIPRMFRESVLVWFCRSADSSPGPGHPLRLRPARREAGHAQGVKMERPTDERSSPLGHGLLDLSRDVGGGDDPASTSATYQLYVWAVSGGHPRVRVPPPEACSKRFP